TTCASATAAGLAKSREVSHIRSGAVITSSCCRANVAVSGQRASNASPRSAALRVGCPPALYERARALAHGANRAPRALSVAARPARASHLYRCGQGSLTASQKSHLALLGPILAIVIGPISR